MAVPPPLPRARISPFLLIAILLVLLAVVARTVLSSSEYLVHLSLEKLALAVTGILAAATAFVFSVVALCEGRRGWPLAIFMGLASVAIAWFLVPELRQSLVGTVAEVRHSTAQGVMLAQRPIPQVKEAPTAEAVQASIVAWGEEAMVRPYQEHGHHDAAWDDAALQLIRGSALDLAGSRASPGPERLRTLGAGIQRAGCDDPWVLFLIRRLAVHDPDFSEVMGKTAAAVARAGYPPFPLWLAHTEALQAVRRDEPYAAGVLAPVCVGALRGALSAKPLTDGDYRVWCRLISNEPVKSLLQQDGEGVCRAVESIPGMQPWFPLFVRGESEIEQAWLARGSGWANSISAGQWQLFGQHLTTAREALERSVVLEPNRPEAARALITVALGSTGLNEMRRWFESAVQARFDYIPAYEAFRKGLRPRWFGSEQAVLAFGRTCLATQRFDTAVPWQMLRAVQEVAEDRDDADEYYRSEVPWQDLQTMFNGYMAHGNPARRNYYLSNEAVLAAKHGQDGLVAKLLQQLNYQIDPQVAADWNLPVGWLGRMVTFSGPAADLSLAAEHQEEQHPEQALKTLLTAQKLPGLPPLTTEYLVNHIAETQAIIALNSAPWRPLTPPPNLSGWKVGSGTWRNISPAIVEVDTESSGALLTRLEPVGDTWELKGEFELVNQRPGRIEAALIFGPSGDHEHHGFSLRFWTMSHGRPGISLARGLGEEALSKSTDFNGTTSFFVRMANHCLRVRANDGQWFADQPLPEGVTIDGATLLSLGSTAAGEKTVQFRKLEFRTATPGN